MKEYLLFIDTEASDIPKDWGKPYSAEGNWPCIVQLAWIVATKDGEEVKTENHYLKADGCEITPNAIKVHGITQAFLAQHGEERGAVLELLHQDLQRYQPLVVGHFVDLDFHLVGAGFQRIGLDNPLPDLPTFCTMKVTGSFLRRSHHRYLSLEELYQRLFNAPLTDRHNALADATATARCFFHLWQNRDIDERTVAQQQRN